jgi:hypothetical protein
MRRTFAQEREIADLEARLIKRAAEQALEARGEGKPAPRRNEARARSRACIAPVFSAAAGAAPQ